MVGPAESSCRHVCCRCTNSDAEPYLYRAVDSLGHTIDFLLSAQRDAAATKRFFRKALAHPHTVNPRTITVDKNPSYPRAAADMKRIGELWRFSRLRQCKYLNNIMEQDHRRIKRLVRPGRGFDSETNAGWLRGNGDDEEGSGSQNWQPRDVGTIGLHCKTLSDGCSKHRTARCEAHQLSAFATETRMAP